MQYGKQAYTEIRQPGVQFQEPILTYDPQAGRWYGKNEQFSIWMDDATFHADADFWYEWPRWLAGCPPAERRAAVTHCQRVIYGQRCERNDDPRVHFTYR